MKYLILHRTSHKFIFQAQVFDKNYSTFSKVIQIQLNNE